MADGGSRAGPDEGTAAGVCNEGAEVSPRDHRPLTRVTLRYRILDQTGGHRTVAVALEIGDPAVASILKLASDLDLATCSITGLGGFHGARLAYFDVDNGSFIENDLEEQFEVVAFIANLSREETDGRQHLHAHVVLGRSDGTTRGGHLIEATVRPTLELIIQESPVTLPRGIDPRTGLVVLKP